MPQAIWDGYFTGKVGDPTALPIPIPCMYVRMVMRENNQGRVWIGGRPNVPAPIPAGSAGDWNQTPLNPGPNRTEFTGIPYRKEEHIDYECSSSGDIWVDVEFDGDGFHYTVFGNPSNASVDDVMANRMDQSVPVSPVQPDVGA